MATTGNIKTVLITGASSGIGLGIAKAYLERGDNVVLNARNKAKLERVVEQLGHADRTAFVVGDIGLKETSERMVSIARQRFGRVDLLVNNAGVFAAKPLNDYAESDLDGFLSNLKGAYFASQAAARSMREQGGGAIINITTVLAFRGVSAIPSSAPVAAKGGINALTQSLAIELAPHNIRVNSVAPGIIKTPIHGRSDDQWEELNGMQPLGRVGEVKDIVDAVTYLADASFVTGVVLPVDGGVAAGG
ncbi:MAG: SDR family oxidoreductase [Planctomycetes bacterium]|nr:SDR family oxidoreductase [Planctomycetota bacterium]